MIAHLEALGALVLAVAGKVRTADEGFHAVVFDLDAAILDRRHRDGDDRAALDPFHGLGHRVVFQRLDRQRDALLVDIDLLHDRLDDIALAEVLDGVLAAGIPRDVRQVHHAVDVAVEAHEQPELGDVLDLALDHRADRVGFGEHLPRVAHGLFQTQRDAALGLVDLEHHHVNLLRGRDDLAGMDVLLGPGHLRDVDQPLDPGLEFDEGAVVGDVGHAAAMDRADRELLGDGIPRIGLKLLHAEADAVGFLVDLDDLDLHGLADRQDLGGVVDAPPGHVGDVQQAIDAAQVHERTIFGDVLDHALDGLALMQVGDHLGALLGARFLEDGAARHDDVAAAAIHLEDLEGLFQPHQRARVAHGAHIDLAAGQEGDRAAQIDREAALDAPEDRALDPFLVGIGLFEPVPGFLAPRLLARDRGFAAGVLDPVEIDLDLVADRDRGGFAGICEFLQIDAAFHLVADVDDGLARLDGDDLALDHRALLGRVDGEAFVQEGLELLHGRFCGHIEYGFPLRGFLAMRLAPPV